MDCIYWFYAKSRSHRPLMGPKYPQLTLTSHLRSKCHLSVSKVFFSFLSEAPTASYKEIHHKTEVMYAYFKPWMESFIATVSLQLEISSVRLLEFLLTNLPAPLSRVCCHATFMLSQIYCEHQGTTFDACFDFFSLFGTTGFNDFESVNKDKTWKRQQITHISLLPSYHLTVSLPPLPSFW